ncbi:MAG: fused MFS/spermidine synthase [Actinomycetota bacterium]|nr:fused MFS/spermidine synthase [Actinomycetota bacterium]
MTVTAPEREHDRSGARRAPPMRLLVFVVGAGSLGSEIAGARLLAPYFGASTVIWANTIATVLTALSIGYWLGGRLADRRPDLGVLCRVVQVAAVATALVPLLGRPFLGGAVEALDEIAAGAFLGSLLAVTVMLAVPVLLMGTVAPFAIRLSVGSVEESGQVAGRLYAISTIGSLVGVFLSALLLIPLVGTQRTFLLFALAMALVAAARLPRRWWLVPLALAAALAIPPGGIKEDADDGRVIHETDTEYQYARVIEKLDGERTLELNEGVAIHSVYRPDSYLTDNVWDDYIVLPLAVLDRPPRRMAILGNAAGTTARAYGHYFPATEIDGVEIDGEVTEIGRRYFDMDSNPRLHTHTDDARPFLRRSDGGYDTLMLDAYRQPYIPFYLITEEFFELCRARLAEGGVLIVNIGHPEGDEELEKVATATLRRVFPHVMRNETEDTNTLLVASEREPSKARLAGASRTMPPELAAVALTVASQLEPPLRGGDAYTDDRAPVEWLIDRSIVEYAAGER